jgi:hypothetical protein
MKLLMKLLLLLAPVLAATLSCFSYRAPMPSDLPAVAGQSAAAGQPAHRNSHMDLQDAPGRPAYAYQPPVQLAPIIDFSAETQRRQ